MNFVVQDGTDNESFSNTGEHTPVTYPRSEEENNGTIPDAADPAAHEDTAGETPEAQ